MLTHLRVHLLLVVLSGTANLHLNTFLFKRTVVQANKNSKPYQNKILCDYPFLLLYRRGGSRCYLSDIMHLDILRYVLERACKNLHRMQQNKVKKEQAAAPLLNLLLSLISPNGGIYSSNCCGLVPCTLQQGVKQVQFAELCHQMEADIAQFTYSRVGCASGSRFPQREVLYGNGRATGAWQEVRCC